VTDGRTPLLAPGPLVDADWLSDHRDDAAIVDVRWYLDGRSGRGAYEQGHIPGAHFLDIDTDLSAPPSERAGRHPLPAPDTFARALGRIGIDDRRLVVAYDDTGESTAARLWWLLRAIGQPAAVLDGGIATWTSGLSSDPPAARAVLRAPNPWPAADFVDADEVAAAAGGDIVVLDARSAARYRAGDPTVDRRPGHVPGARSAPWTENLDPTTGRFFDAATLRERYRRLGVDARTRTIAYCGSGVTACHDLLALELAGFSHTALYPGSWSAWAADEDRPAETGPGSGLV
jgi:thiosulfate/3-mercaptopyruvate sulfurtransferase